MKYELCGDAEYMGVHRPLRFAWWHFCDFLLYRYVLKNKQKQTKKQKNYQMNVLKPIPIT